ncbi:MAG: hypothetical protein FJ197_07410 [Gammaproteobacteria bacterium]|nr:hypothetical protein [Gammaproteobacteria bacterium]
MTASRIALCCFLIGSASFATLAIAADTAPRPLVRYSYTGPPMTVITGVVAPWTRESRITGYFVVPELPANYTTDFLDPDIVWPFPNLPAEFSFTDGARTITRDSLEDVMKITGDRLDPHKHEVRAFSVTTDARGNIKTWDVLFVHDVRRNTFLTNYNGGIHGQDLTEVDTSHFGCVATEKCTANANYTSKGAILADTQPPGTWAREVIGPAEGAGR